MGFNGNGQRTHLEHCRVCGKPFRPGRTVRRDAVTCSMPCHKLARQLSWQLIRTVPFQQLLELTRRLETRGGPPASAGHGRPGGLA